MKCPKCGEEQYAVCSNPDCKCYTWIPKGRLPQINHEETISCPYCGFTAVFDFWEDLAFDQILEETGANSLTEAMEIKQRRNETGDN